MSKLNYINGDLFKLMPKNDKLKIITHVCNDIGVWGGGFTAPLTRHYPEALKTYQEAYKSKDFSIGKTYWTHHHSDNVSIANMIAQHNVIPHETKPIRYASLVDCMRQVNEIDKITTQDFEIHAPKFGSALAGGNWDFIEELIKEMWVGNGIDVTVYVL